MGSNNFRFGLFEINIYGKCAKSYYCSFFKLCQKNIYFDINASDEIVDSVFVGNYR